MKTVLRSFAIPLVQALVVLMFLAWLSAGKAQAAIEMHQFDNPVLQKRYDSLTAALRCPKCQNQAIGAFTGYFLWFLLTKTAVLNCFNGTFKKCLTPYIKVVPEFKTSSTKTRDLFL